MKTPEGTRSTRKRALLTLCIILPAYLVIFGPSAIAYGPESPVAMWLASIGYFLTAAGILWEHWQPEPGIAIVATGLALILLAGSNADLLAYGVVCHQAWFISAYSRRRNMWLALLILGACTYCFLGIHAPELGIRALGGP